MYSYNQRNDILGAISAEKINKGVRLLYSIVHDDVTRVEDWQAKPASKGTNT